MRKAIAILAVTLAFSLVRWAVFVRALQHEAKRLSAEVSDLFMWNDPKVQKDAIEVIPRILEPRYCLSAAGHWRWPVLTTAAFLLWGRRYAKRTKMGIGDGPAILLFMTMPMLVGLGLIPGFIASNMALAQRSGYPEIWVGWAATEPFCLIPLGFWVGVAMTAWILWDRLRHSRFGSASVESRSPQPETEIPERECRSSDAASLANSVPERQRKGPANRASS